MKRLVRRVGIFLSWLGECPSMHLENDIDNMSNIEFIKLESYDKYKTLC